MKMAEPCSDNEDIFAGSTQNCTNSEEEPFQASPVYNRPNNCEMTSDEEIDDFIRSSQSPTRDFVSSANVNISLSREQIPGIEMKTSKLRFGIKSDSEIVKDTLLCTQELGPLSLAMPSTQDFNEQIVDAADHDNLFSQDLYQLSLEMPSTQIFDAQIRHASESNKSRQRDIFPVSPTAANDYDDHGQSEVNLTQCPENTRKFSQENKKLFPITKDQTDFDARYKTKCSAYKVAECPISEKKEFQPNKKIIENVLGTNNDFSDSCIENDNITNELEATQYSISRVSNYSTNRSISSSDTEPYEIDGIFQSQSKTSSFDLKAGQCNTNVSLSSPNFTEPISPSLMQEDDYSDNTNNKASKHFFTPPKTPELTNFDSYSTDSNVEEELRENFAPNSPSLLQVEDYSENIFCHQEPAEKAILVVKPSSPKYSSVDSQARCYIMPNSPSLLQDSESFLTCTESKKEPTNENWAKKSFKHNVLNVCDSRNERSFDNIANDTKATDQGDVPVSPVNFDEPTQISPHLDIDFEACTQVDVQFIKKAKSSDNNVATTEDVVNFDEPTQILPHLDIDFEACTQVDVQFIKKAKSSDNNVAITEDVVNFDEPTQISPHLGIDSEACTQVDNSVISLVIPERDEQTKIIPNVKKPETTEKEDGGEVDSADSKEIADNFSECDFDALTQKMPNTKTNVTDPDMKVDFDAPTQLMLILNSNIKVPPDKVNFDDVDFDAATQRMPINKSIVFIPAKEDDFDAAAQITRKSNVEVPANDDVDFDASTQKMPIRNQSAQIIKSNVTFLTNHVDVGVLANEASFHDINFDAPTQMMPIKNRPTQISRKSVVGIPANEVNFDDVDFDAPTQIIPIIKSNLEAPADKIDFYASTQISRQSNDGVSADNVSFDDIDFDAPTQMMPIKNRPTHIIRKSVVGIPANEVNFDDVDFDAPTQKMPTGNRTTQISEKSNVTNPINEINFDDVDFDAPTQKMPSLYAKNSRTALRDNFSECDFDALTQVMPSTVDVNKVKNYESSIDEREVNSEVSVRTDPKNSVQSENDPPSILMKNNNGDSTDCEIEETVPSRIPSVGQNPSLCSTKIRSTSTSKSQHCPLPSPPQDVHCGDNYNSLNSEDEAYMLPTQIDSQSRCLPQQNQINIISTVTNADEINSNSTSPLADLTNSNNSSELPSTPDFERQLAEAERVFIAKRKQKELAKSGPSNINESETLTRPPKRKRRMTWKMSALLNNNSNTSSESFYNAGADSSTDRDTSAFMTTRNSEPLPNVNIVNTDSAKKYNTRLSIRNRQSLENISSKRHKPYLRRRRRGRIIDSGDENESPDTSSYHVAFAVNPKSSYRSIIENLGGNIVQVHEANVFICDKFRRTIKVLCALSRGILMVTSKWILESRQHHRLLDPRKYKLNDEVAEKRWQFKLQNSLKKAEGTKLLLGYTVHTTPNVTPRASEIYRLIESCDGSSMKELPRVWPTKSLVVSCRDDSRFWSAAPKHVKVVEVQFIINSIIHQKLDFSQPLLR